MRTLQGIGDQLLHLLTAHPLRDHRGDAVALHGHAVERVGDLHGRLLVRDDDELRLGPQLLEKAMASSAVALLAL